MTREEFGREFMRAMRFVIQKHDRVNEATWSLEEMGSRPELENRHALAQTNLDAAISQLGDHVYDAIEQRATTPEAAD